MWSTTSRSGHDSSGDEGAGSRSESALGGYSSDVSGLPAFSSLSSLPEPALAYDLAALGIGPLHPPLRQQLQGGEQPQPSHPFGHLYQQQPTASEEVGRQQQHIPSYLDHHDPDLMATLSLHPARPLGPIGHRSGGRRFSDSNPGSETRLSPTALLQRLDL